MKAFNRFFIILLLLIFYSAGEVYGTHCNQTSSGEDSSGQEGTTDGTGTTEGGTTGGGMKTYDEGEKDDFINLIPEFPGYGEGGSGKGAGEGGGGKVSTPPPSTPMVDKGTMDGIRVYRRGEGETGGGKVSTPGDGKVVTTAEKPGCGDCFIVFVETLTPGYEISQKAQGKHFPWERQFEKDAYNKAVAFCQERYKNEECSAAQECDKPREVTTESLQDIYPDDGAAQTAGVKSRIGIYFRCAPKTKGPLVGDGDQGGGVILVPPKDGDVVVVDTGGKEVTDTPKTPPKETDTSDGTTKESCCCIKKIVFRNSTDLPVKFSIYGPQQPTVIGPGESFTVSEEAECLRISFWYPDPDKNWAFAGQREFCCDDLVLGPVKNFPGLEIVSFEKGDCPPEKCMKKGGGGGIVEEPKQPPKEPPKKPEPPPKPKGPKKPPTTTGGTVVVDGTGEGTKKIPDDDKKRPPPPVFLPTCECKFLDKEWIPWQTIEGKYVYIPSPMKNKRILLTDTLEFKAMGNDQDILIVRSVKTVNGEVVCQDSQNVYSPDLLDYLWKIVQGPGKFKNGQKQDKGESVIYIPPPDLAFGQHQVNIETTIDDIGDKGNDGPKKGQININIERKKEEPDYYYIDFYVVDFPPVETPALPPVTDCSCEITTNWEEGGKIDHYIVKPDGSEIICTDCTDTWIGRGADDDQLTVTCTDTKCGTDKKAFMISDVLVHRWSAEAGSYLGDNTGTKVLYKAPKVAPPKPAPNEKIELNTRDSGKQYIDAEPEKKEKKITIAEVDLDIFKYDGTAVYEDEEETNGVRICLDCDDDNKNDKEDRTEKDVEGEDDLVKLILQKPEPKNLPGKVILRTEQNKGIDRGAVKIWEEPRKSKEVPSGKQYSVDELPKTLWVEGVSGSSRKNDVKIILEYPKPDGDACRDAVKATIMDAEIVSIKDKQGKDIYLYKLGSGPMTVTYKITPEEVKVDRLEVEIVSKAKEIVYRKDIPTTSGTFTWDGTWNQAPNEGSSALPIGNPYKMKIFATIDGHRCLLEEREIKTELESDIEIVCGHGQKRKVKRWGVLGVVPALTGDRITLVALPTDIKFPEGYPKWTIEGYWSTELQGQKVSFNAHGFNAEGVIPWLIDYIPHTYEITAEIDDKTKHKATVEAYPITKGEVSLNIGRYFKSAEEVWNALPTNGIEPLWPHEEASISFEDQWKESPEKTTAYLWCAGNANLDPLIGLEGRFNLLGGITPPKWIRDYVDIGVYVVASGKLSLVGAFEAGEEGVSGSLDGGGVLGVGLEGVLKADELLKGTAGGSWDALELELSSRPYEGWIQWKGDLNTGPISLAVSFELLWGWVTLEKEWEVFEGANIKHLSPGGEYTNLWRYKKAKVNK